MRNKILHCHAIVVAVFLFVWAPNLYALSLGPIKVKSNFGERFDAEIELTAEARGEVKVIIGTPKDYSMLQINRTKIVSKLRIDKLVDVGRGKKIIRIKSDIPLFFPSFDLVVRVSQNDGTLLENYLITVDFRQMVSLGVHVDEKKRKKIRKKKISRKPADLLKTVQTNNAVAVKQDSRGREVQQAAIVPKAIAVSRDPKPERMKLARKAPPSPVRLTSPVTQIERSARSQAMVPPIPVIIPSKKYSSVERQLPALMPKSFSQLATTQADSNRKTRMVVPFKSKNTLSDSAARPLPHLQVNLKTLKISKAPKTSEALTVPKALKMSKALKVPEALKMSKAPKTSKALKIPKALKMLKVSETSKPSKTYGPLTEGETLSKIVTKLKIDSFGESKVTVAIWLDNWDRFIGGNIHGIKKGVVLDMGNVQNRLRQISGRMARMILLNHWREWKIIRQKLSRRPVEQDAQPAIQEVPLPAEKISDKAEIFRLLESWRKSWENKKIDRHMATFSKGFRIMKANGKDLQFADWKEFKLRMFKRYKNVTIRIHRPKLIQMGDRLLASFYQSFDSDKLHSFGHKTLELVRESGEWKIINERFKSRPRAGQDASPSFVVHSSSHLHFDEARRTVNQLREKGLNAYLSPLNLTPQKIIYRIYVERFSDWAMAAQMARFLRAWEFSRYATPAPVSFSLLAGSFAEEAQAAERVDFLRKNGISALLFSTSNEGFSSPSFKVMVGAYSYENETHSIKHQLIELRIPFQLADS